MAAFPPDQFLSRYCAGFAESVDPFEQFFCNTSNKIFFSADNNNISNGRITSGQSFRRVFAPDPLTVSIHSNNFISIQAKKACEFAYKPSNKI
jgi:hypothetical protein